VLLKRRLEGFFPMHRCQTANDGWQHVAVCAIVRLKWDFFESFYCILSRTEGVVMLILNKYFYKNNKSQFGEDVAVLNDMFYDYAGSIYYKDRIIWKTFLTQLGSALALTPNLSVL
jgi:hypothetical protein